jgi:hypothetical protein
MICLSKYVLYTINTLHLCFFRLTEGAEVTTQLSIGHLELTEDLAKSLPVALENFDVVVVGDSSFQFTKSLVEDLLGVRH